MQEKTKILKPIVIGVLCSLVIYFLSFTPFMKKLEYQMYDLRVCFRGNRLFKNIQSPTHKRSPLVCVVSIDDKTLKEIKEPMYFWTPYFIDVLQSLINGGAKVIALDYQYQISSDKFLNERILDVVNKLTKGKDVDVSPYLSKNDVKMALLLRQGKVILPVSLKEDGSFETPYKPYSYAAGVENLGLVSASPDFDGTLRRQALYKTGKLLMAKKDENVFAFAFLSASKLLGKEIRYSNGQIYLGDIPIPHDKKYRTIINYIAPEGTFVKEYSFVDLLRKAQNNDTKYFEKNFKGKAVLIGPAFSGSNDIVLTPYNIINPLEMYGIEVHANFLNTLVMQDFIIPLPLWKEVLIFLLFGILTSLVCYYKKPLWAVTFLIFVAVLFVGVSFLIMYRFNVWMNTVNPLGCMFLAFASVYTYRYVVEDSHKRYLRKVLEKYVSKDVADEILKDPSNLSLGGKRANVSILFCDINNFTTFSETNPPEDVISILNDYFTRMVDVIFKNKGTLKQFVGDEIMVICGAPRENPDHPMQACTIGVEMLEELDRWQEERRKDNLPVFDVKIGIHTGDVVVGNVGSYKRVEYTAVGDVVNTASRIMGLTKKVKYRILISEETYKRVKDYFEVEEGGSFTVKGRQKPVKVYKLIKKKN